MNRKQDMALVILNKSASLHAARLRKQAAWTDNVKDFFSNPDNQRLMATYALPTIVGGGIGALANKRNRLLGALLGMGGGAAVGGGLHALQHYNVGGFGDWTKGLFAPKTPFDPVTDQPYDVPDQMASSDKYQKEKPQQVTNVSPKDPNNPINSPSVQAAMKAQKEQTAAEAKRNAAIAQQETKNLNDSVAAEQAADAGNARLATEQAKARAERTQMEQTDAENRKAFAKEPNTAGYYDAEDAARTMRAADETSTAHRTEVLRDKAKGMYNVATPLSPDYDERIRRANRTAAEYRALRDNGGPSPAQRLSDQIVNANAEAAGTAALNAEDSAEYDARVGEAQVAAQRRAERRAELRERQAMEARMDRAAENASRNGFDEPGDVPFGAFDEPNAGVVSAPAQEAREILRRLSPDDPNYDKEMGRVNELNAQSRAARGEASPAEVLSALGIEQAANEAAEKEMTEAANSADRAEYDARVGEEAIRDPYTARMNALRMRANRLAQAQLASRANAPSFLWAPMDFGTKNYDQEMAAINREMAQLRALRDGKRLSPAQALSRRIIARENRRRQQYEDLVNGYRGGSFEDTFGH